MYIDFPYSWAVWAAWALACSSASFNASALSLSSFSILFLALSKALKASFSSSGVKPDAVVTTSVTVFPFSCTIVSWTCCTCFCCSSASAWAFAWASSILLASSWACFSASFRASSLSLSSFSILFLALSKALKASFSSSGLSFTIPVSATFWAVSWFPASLILA